MVLLYYSRIYYDSLKNVILLHTEGFDEYHLFFHLLQVSFHQTQRREQLDNNIFFTISFTPFSIKWTRSLVQRTAFTIKIKDLKAMFSASDLGGPSDWANLLQVFLKPNGSFMNYASLFGEYVN